MARIELNVDGRNIIDAEVNLAALVDLFQTIDPLEGTAEAKSTAITSEQAELLLKRIDPKSVEFLRRIAFNKGFVTWSEMQKIFGIEGTEWSDFSAHHGRGITRALRHITKGKLDALFHWNDDEPEWHTDDWRDGRVYVDGKALDALRTTFKMA